MKTQNKLKASKYGRVLILCSLGSLLLNSCGVAKNDPVAPRYEMKSIDEVKQISENTKSPYAEDSVLQGDYLLSGSSRLLLRLGSFADAKKTVDASTLRLLLRVTCTDLLKKDCAERIHPFALRRDWTLAATWQRAFPFGGVSGLWRSPGGDFDSAIQIVAGPSNLVVEGEIHPGSVFFDVTAWYQNFAQARGQNFGLILTTTEEVRVYGDSSGYLGPKFYWVAKQVDAKGREQWVVPGDMSPTDMAAPTSVSK